MEDRVQSLMGHSNPSTTSERIRAKHVKILDLMFEVVLWIGTCRAKKSENVSNVCSGCASKLMGGIQSLAGIQSSSECLVLESLGGIDGRYCHGCQGRHLASKFMYETARDYSLKSRENIPLGFKSFNKSSDIRK